MKALFKSGATLRKLDDYFKQQANLGNQNYRVISYALELKIKKYYPNVSSS